MPFSDYSNAASAQSRGQARECRILPHDLIQTTANQARKKPPNRNGGSPATGAQSDLSVSSLAPCITGSQRRRRDTSLVRKDANSQVVENISIIDHERDHKLGRSGLRRRSPEPPLPQTRLALEHASAISHIWSRETGKACFFQHTVALLSTWRGLSTPSGLVPVVPVSEQVIQDPLGRPVRAILRIRTSAEQIPRLLACVVCDAAYGLFNGGVRQVGKRRCRLVQGVLLAVCLVRNQDVPDDFCLLLPPVSQTALLGPTSRPCSHSSSDIVYNPLGCPDTTPERRRSPLSSST